MFIFRKSASGACQIGIHFFYSFHLQVHNKYWHLGSIFKPSFNLLQVRHITNNHLPGVGCFSLSVPRIFASISERSMFLSLMVFCGSKKRNNFDHKLLLIINKRDCIRTFIKKKNLLRGQIGRVVPGCYRC